MTCRRSGTSSPRKTRRTSAGSESKFSVEKGVRLRERRAPFFLGDDLCPVDGEGSLSNARGASACTPGPGDGVVAADTALQHQYVLTASILGRNRHSKCALHASAEIAAQGEASSFGGGSGEARAIGAIEREIGDAYSTPTGLSKCSGESIDRRPSWRICKAGAPVAVDVCGTGTAAASRHRQPQR